MNVIRAIWEAIGKCFKIVCLVALAALVLLLLHFVNTGILLALIF